MQKGLTIGIIFLFITVSIAPGVNFIIVKASNDNDFVEITSQACGPQGFENSTVKLTRQQYENLEQHLVYFRARMNQTTTKEDVVLLFKQAVVELNKYGLLPNGMSVQQAQKLVSGDLSSSKILNLLNKILLPRNKNVEIPNDVLNLFCYVYAHTYFAFEDNIWILVASVFGHLDFQYDLKIFGFLNSLFYEYSQLKLYRFMNRIWVAGPGIGGITYSYFSLGLLGIHKGSNDFDTAYGFSGIKLILEYEEAVYFGFALIIT